LVQSNTVYVTVAKIQTSLSLSIEYLGAGNWRATGKLTRNDTGAGVPGKSIWVYAYDPDNVYRGTFGLITTDTNGNFDKQQNFPVVVGTWAFFAEFEGDDEFEGCDENDDVEKEALQWLLPLL